MRAIVHTRYGPPENLRLENVAKPEPASGEVLVKVHASTMNRSDTGFLAPEYFILRLAGGGLFRPRQRILGNEFSGVIEAVAPDVTEFKPGDKVFGQTGMRFGAHAEYLCLPAAGALAPMPARVSFDAAAAACDGAHYATVDLRAAQIGPGKSVMVYGASGSIGTAAVQLAKAMGAHVTAVTDTARLKLAKSLGADRVIDYTREEYTAGENLYDFVFDSVGKSSFFLCRKLLKPGGVYISTELGFLGQNVWLPLVTKLFGKRRVLFPMPRENKEEILWFKSLIEAGKFKPVIDRTYPLAQAVVAAHYVRLGQKTGNVVIAVAKPTAARRAARGGT